MALAKGSKSGLAYKEESAWGTFATGDFAGLAIVSETLAEQINKVMSAEIRPDRTKPAIRGGNVAAGGSITTDLGVDRFGLFLKHLLTCVPVTTELVDADIDALAEQAYVRGDLVKSNDKFYLCTLGGTVSDMGGGLTHTSGIAAIDGVKFEYLSANDVSVYRHVFTGGNTMPTGGLSFEKSIKGGSSDLFVQFRGGRVDSLDLTIPQEGAVQAAWNLLFKDSVKASATGAGTVTYVAEEPVTGYEAFISFNNGQTTRPVRSGSLKIANSLEADVYCVGERTRREIPEKDRECSGSLDVYFQDATEYDIFKNETVVNTKISFNRNGEFLQFEFPETKFTGSGTPQIAGSGVVTAKLEMSVFRQSAAFDVKATMISLSATLR